MRLTAATDEHTCTAAVPVTDTHAANPMTDTGDTAAPSAVDGALTCTPRSE
jgi:hypothetical protein